MTFEENINALEDIIKKLEDENVSLNDSIKLYKNGIKIVGQCNSMLDKVEKDIKMLDEEV